MQISAANLLIASQPYAKAGQTRSNNASSGEAFSLSDSSGAATASNQFAPMAFKTVAKEAVIAAGNDVASQANSAAASAGGAALGYGSGARLGSAVDITV